MFGSGISSTGKKSEKETVMRAASMLEDMSNLDLESSNLALRKQSMIVVVMLQYKSWYILAN